MGHLSESSSARRLGEVEHCSPRQYGLPFQMQNIAPFDRIAGTVKMGQVFCLIRASGKVNQLKAKRGRPGLQRAILGRRNIILSSHN